MVAVVSDATRDTPPIDMGRHSPVTPSHHPHDSPKSQKSHVRLHPAEPGECGTELVALVEDFVGDQRTQQGFVGVEIGVHPLMISAEASGRTCVPIGATTSTHKAQLAAIATAQ